MLPAVLGLYGFITFVMEGTAAVLMVLLGLEVVPPFDQPWRSISIADFWSRCGHAREMERQFVSDASTDLPVTDLAKTGHVLGTIMTRASVRESHVMLAAYAAYVGWREEGIAVALEFSGSCFGLMTGAE